MERAESSGSLNDSVYNVPSCSSSALLVRKHLWQQLESYRSNHPVIWINGPPGSGKTHLASSYLESDGVLNLWYQLDQGDDDPATFFHYLSKAYRRYVNNDHQLPSFTVTQSNVEVFARQFFEALYAGLGDKFVVVLDQYHELSEDSRIHDLVLRGINELPEGCCFFIISRSDPPPTLVRLRINKQMRNVGWQDLRLSDNEVMTLAEMSGFAGSQEEALKIQERLHGWCAGIVLMLDHFQGRQIPAKLDFSNFDVLLNYFAGEILANRSDQEVDFLFRSSFLPYMTPELAHQISGNERAGNILAKLYANHAFTERRSLDGPTYQFHPLFRKFLRGRLEEFYGKSDLKEVKQRAAAVLWEHGFIEHAAKLLFEIQDWEILQDMVCKHTMDLIVAGRGRTVVQWFNLLNEDVMTDYPWFLYWLAKAQLSYDPSGARQHFERAYRAFTEKGTDEDGRWSSWAGIVETFLHEWRDFSQLDQWIEEINFGPGEVLENIQPSTRVALIVSVFSAYVYRRPDHKDLELWEYAVQRLLRTDIDINQRIMIGNQLVLYYTWTGQHPKITVVIETMREDAVPEKIAPLNFIVWRSMQAMHAWLSLDTDGAAAAAKAGLEQAEQSGVHVWDFMLFGQMCYANLIAGKLSSAKEYLNKMSRAINTCRFLDAAHYHYLGAWYSLLENNIPTALEKAKLALDFAHDSGSPIPQGLAAAGLAQVAFEHKNYELAEKMLAEVKEAGVKFNSNHFQHHALVLRAYFDLALGNDAKALRPLQEAFQFAKEKGYWVLTWWRPKMMSYLCSRALKHNIEFARDVIHQYEIIPEYSWRKDSSQSWSIRIRTFGGLVIEGGGDALAKKMKGKPADLMRALLAKGGKQVEEKSITDALWPDSDGDFAHNSFNTTLHRLRRLLGSEKTLILSGGKLSLNENICWFDVWHFDALVEHVNKLITAGPVDASALSGLQNDMFEIYQGSFFGDHGYSLSDTLQERERGRFVRIVEKLGGWWVHSGDYDKAIRCYKRAVERESLVEVFYQRLIVLYGETGRKLEIENLYSRYKKLFQETLGTMPSDKTLSLYQQTISGL